MVGRYQRHDVCAVARIGNASGRCGIDRRPMTIYGVGVGVSQLKAHGEAASTKLNTVTHSYYDGILKAYGFTSKRSIQLYPGYSCNLYRPWGQDSDRVAGPLTCGLT